MKVAAIDDTTHNPCNETHWVSCLRENLTSSSYGEGLETDQATTQVPRQSFTRQLVFQRMKQLLRFNQLRSTHRTTVEATVRALLVAWAVQEDIGAEMQRLLRAITATSPRVISRWLVTSIGRDT